MYRNLFTICVEAYQIMAALLILKVSLKLVELNSRFGIIILYRGVLVRVFIVDPVSKQLLLLIDL